MAYLSSILSILAIIISAATYVHNRQVYKQQKRKDEFQKKQNILDISNDITFVLEHNISYLEDRKNIVKLLLNRVLIEGLGEKLNETLKTLNDEIEKQHQYLQSNDEFINKIILIESENLDETSLYSQLELKKILLTNFRVLSKRYSDFYKFFDDIL